MRKLNILARKEAQNKEIQKEKLPPVILAAKKDKKMENKRDISRLSKRRVINIPKPTAGSQKPESLNIILITKKIIMIKLVRIRRVEGGGSFSILLKNFA